MNQLEGGYSGENSFKRVKLDVEQKPYFVSPDDRDRIMAELLKTKLRPEERLAVFKTVVAKMEADRDQNIMEVFRSTLSGNSEKVVEKNGEAFELNPDNLLKMRAELFDLKLTTARRLEILKSVDTALKQNPDQDAMEIFHTLTKGVEKASAYNNEVGQFSEETPVKAEKQVIDVSFESDAEEINRAREKAEREAKNKAA